MYCLLFEPRSGGASDMQLGAENLAPLGMKWLILHQPSLELLGFCPLGVLYVRGYLDRNLGSFYGRTFMRF